MVKVVTYSALVRGLSPQRGEHSDASLRAAESGQREIKSRNLGSAALAQTTASGSMHLSLH